ncbi:MAG: hypothetical protein IT463_01455 [Planctomycetes bacterium]|nr:hypothetical protein [Planctomycetota bacterium]
MLLALPFALTACASGPRPLLDSPDAAVTAMRDAYRQDEPGLFLHCLSRPVLKVYSEHVLRVGWSEIRPRVGDLVAAAEVVSRDSYQAPQPLPLPLPPEGCVNPEAGLPLLRVRLRVQGREEDFLFQREVDPAPPAARQAAGFWVGDRYFVRSEHPSPQTYLFEDSPEEGRTHWRLVFPYAPFQQGGELTRLLQEKLAAEAERD